MEITTRFDPATTHECHRRGPAEIKTAHRGETTGIEAVVNRGVVTHPADIGGVAQHMPSRMIGPLVEQEILAKIGVHPWVLECPRDIFAANFEIVPLCWQKRAIAGIVDRGESESMERIVAHDIIQIGESSWNRGDIANLDAFSTIGRDRRQIILQPLMTNRNTSPQTRFIPVGVSSIKIRAAQAKIEGTIK